MLDPKLAIDELEYAVRELGFKTAVFAGHARRPIGDRTATAYRLDTFGVDSAYDYDPLWAKCVELGVAPVFHSSLQSHRVTRSATSYVYNHIGGLAANHESLCKSLFLSGVTHRFPTLRFGFLEGGVAWACSLFSAISSVTGRSATRDDDPDARSRPARRRRADRAVRALRRRACARRSRRAPRVLHPPERPARAARRVRGGRARLGRRPARPLRARTSTSAARPTTGSSRGRSPSASTPPARGCGRSSAPTSRTGTCPT